MEHEQWWSETKALASEEMPIHIYLLKASNKQKKNIFINSHENKIKKLTAYVRRFSLSIRLFVI